MVLDNSSAMTVFSLVPGNLAGACDIVGLSFCVSILLILCNASDAILHIDN